MPTEESDSQSEAETLENPAYSPQRVQTEEVSECPIAERFPESGSGEEWELGIDEAGRGPAVGPMVFAGMFCPSSRMEEMRSIGLAGTV
jgi:ribonuclease HIII